MKIYELQRPNYRTNLIFDAPDDDFFTIERIVERLPLFCISELNIKRMNSFRLSLQIEPLRSAILRSASIKSGKIGRATAALPGDLIVSLESRPQIEKIIASEMIEARWTELVSVSGSPIAVNLFTDFWRELVSPQIGCSLTDAWCESNRYMAL
jgi:hypothetical protein